MTRTELFNYHMLYDVVEFGNKGEHYYVYSLPYYHNMYNGRHIFPEGAKLYLITAEWYAELVTMKHKNKAMCQRFVETNIDVNLIHNQNIDGFTYIGDKKDYIGSIPSVVMQVLTDCVGKLSKEPVST